MGGKLIVFEGVEGSGKTTQLQRCSNWLQASGLLESLGVPGEKTLVALTREPGGTSLGLGLRQLLLGEHSSPIQDRAELLMYAADRAQHVEEFLKPQLANGTIILCDRYTDSTIAYQGYGRGLDLRLIQQLNQIATDGLESDLTLWLDIDAETGLKRARQRGTADRIEQADLTFHQRVQQGFAQLATSNPHRIVRIDASKSEEEVHLAIQEILRQRFSEWFQKLTRPS
jgi:dTMP kinase